MLRFNPDTDPFGFFAPLENHNANVSASRGEKVELRHRRELGARLGDADGTGLGNAQEMNPHSGRKLIDIRYLI